MRTRALRSFLLTVCIWQLAACVETLDASYSTFAEAQGKGAVAAGWVPAWIPPDATDIREVHNMDTNQFMLTFTVPKSAQLSLPVGCVQVPPRTPKTPPFSRQWWPGDVPANGFATHRHAFFACQEYFVAHSASLGEGYVWSRN